MEGGPCDLIENHGGFTDVYPASGNAGIALCGPATPPGAGGMMAEAAAIAGPAPSKLLAPDGNIPPPESAGLGTAGTYGSRWLAAKGAGVTSRGMSTELDEGTRCTAKVVGQEFHKGFQDSNLRSASGRQAGE